MACWLYKYPLGAVLAGEQRQLNSLVLDTGEKIGLAPAMLDAFLSAPENIILARSAVIANVRLPPTLDDRRDKANAFELGIDLATYLRTLVSPNLITESSVKEALFDMQVRLVYFKETFPIDAPTDAAQGNEMFMTAQRRIADLLERLGPRHGPIVKSLCVLSFSSMLYLALKSNFPPDQQAVLARSVELSGGLLGLSSQVVSAFLDSPVQWFVSLQNATRQVVGF
jgi:hypothetical protein